MKTIKGSQLVTGLASIFMSYVIIISLLNTLADDPEGPTMAALFFQQSV